MGIAATASAAIAARARTPVPEATSTAGPVPDQVVDHNDPVTSASRAKTA
jgi:hypothetical protein